MKNYYLVIFASANFLAVYVWGNVDEHDFEESCISFQVHAKF